MIVILFLIERRSHAALCQTKLSFIDVEKPRRGVVLSELFPYSYYCKHLWIANISDLVPVKQSMINTLDFASVIV